MITGLLELRGVHYILWEEAYFFSPFFSEKLLAMFNSYMWIWNLIFMQHSACTKIVFIYITKKRQNSLHKNIIKYIKSTTM